MGTVDNHYKLAVFDARRRAFTDICELERFLSGVDEMVAYAWQGGEGSWIPESLWTLGSRVRAAADGADEVLNTTFAREEWFVDEDSWQAHWRALGWR